MGVNARSPSATVPSAIFALLTTPVSRVQIPEATVRSPLSPSVTLEAVPPATLSSCTHAVPFQYFNWWRVESAHSCPSLGLDGVVPVVSGRRVLTGIPDVSIAAANLGMGVSYL